MNLYSFNKVSWRTGYDNKGQHFEKRRYCPPGYGNKTRHFGGEVSVRCLPQRFSDGKNNDLPMTDLHKNFSSGRKIGLRKVTTVRKTITTVV